MDNILDMKHITKRFLNVIANDSIDFSLRQGEIHGLLGENGAGKSTLMNILYGMYEADDGDIYVNGKHVNITSPGNAINLGIGMVHQHFMLVPSFTVFENILTGLKSSLLSFFKLNSIRKHLRHMSDMYGFNIDPDAYIWQLSVGEQQRVEILKTLYYGAKILVLDEPTAVLTPKECEDFFSILNILIKNGLSVIFITHKLKEVMDTTHRVTVLRDGKKIDTVNTVEMNEKSLARMMIGREISLHVEKLPLNKKAMPVVRVEHISATDDRKLPALEQVNFFIKEGEIFGMAGVDGNGQKELSEVLTGMRKVKKGKIFINNIEIRGFSPEQINALHVSHIPEDRSLTGTVANFNLEENAILGCPSFYNNMLLDWKKVNKFTENLIEKYDIKAGNTKVFADSLSGGNLQKLIIARELSKNPVFIVAVHPTRGLDPGAIEYVHKVLMEERSKGTAILLISTDLNEIFSLSDTIGVMYKGKIVGQMSQSEACVEKVGLLMAGVFSEQ
ncbi:MAG: ABC transporter ATP-binding protein [Candidatus Eremiobacterota bacterium]